MCPNSGQGCFATEHFLALLQVLLLPSGLQTYPATQKQHVPPSQSSLPSFRASCWDQQPNAARAWMQCWPTAAAPALGKPVAVEQQPQLLTGAAGQVLLQLTIAYLPQGNFNSSVHFS
jgi:hypothetical protein